MKKRLLGRLDDVVDRIPDDQILNVDQALIQKIEEVENDFRRKRQNQGAPRKSLRSILTAAVLVMLLPVLNLPIEVPR